MSTDPMQMNEDLGAFYAKHTPYGRNDGGVPLTSKEFTRQSLARQTEEYSFKDAEAAK